MVRRLLNDRQWGIIKELIPGREGSPGGRGKDNRQFIEAVLWIARTGSPWRDLPEDLGYWNSVFQRYRRWCQSGIWETVFRMLSSDPDFEYAMIDSTTIRAHQQAAGAKGGKKNKNSEKALGDSPRRYMLLWTGSAIPLTSF